MTTDDAKRIVRTMSDEGIESDMRAMKAQMLAMPKGPRHADAVAAIVEVLQVFMAEKVSRGTA